MKQLSTKFLKDKAYHVMFLWFKIYFILLYVNNILFTKTNMFFVLAFLNSDVQVVE